MNKTIHHISTPYSRGPLERMCIESWKRDYPDFEIKEWEISRIDSGFGNEILRILHENGGLFFGNDSLSIRRIPDELFEKCFISSDNTSIYRGFDPSICSYCEKGETVFSDIREGKSTEFKGLDWREFGMHDRINGELFNDGYVLKMNPRFDRVIPNVKLVYSIIDENTTEKRLHDLVDRFCRCKDDKPVFLLLVCTAPEKVQMVSFACQLLEYNCNERLGGNRMWDMVPIYGGNEENVVEIVGRRFPQAISFEKIIV